jgi:H+/Cl- antiporter ClcA
MTDRHSIIFYLMLAALISNLIGNLIDKKSFYDYLKEEYVVNIERKIRRKHNKVI